MLCPPTCAPLQVRHLVVAGGVAANAYVRGRLSAVAADAGLRLVCPPPRLCTDNGVMVAWAGVERQVAGRGRDCMETLADWTACDFSACACEMD